MNTNGASRRAKSGLEQILRWYIGPVGLLFGLGLLATVVVALLDYPGIAVALLAATLGVVLPWKLIRQRNELRLHASETAATTSAIAQQLDSTVTRSGLAATVKGFRQADRQTMQKLRGKGRLTEDSIKETLREVRIALLEADVALPVVQSFIGQVKHYVLHDSAVRYYTG